MPISKIDTDIILSTAEAIKSVNNTLNTGIEEIRKKNDSLGNSWNSKAGAQARSLLYQLLSGNDARSSVLVNYENLLRHVVNGTVNVETANKSLADNFK